MGGITKQFGGLFKGITKSVKGIFSIFNVLSGMTIMETITDILGTFSDILGIAFLPVITALYQAFIPLIPTFTEMALSFQPIIALGVELISTFGLFKFILPAISMGFKFIANSLNGITPLIENFTLAIKAISLEDIGNWFVSLPSLIVEWLQTGINNIRNFFINLVSNIWNWLVEGFNNLSTQAATGAAQLWDAVIFWD